MTAHRRWVRLSHWILAASVLTLAVTGFIILMAHPRLYWGAVGNDLTPAFLELPISRNYQHGGWEAGTAFFSHAGSPVTASRTYDILNQNGWGRSLHFLAAWFLVATGAIYVLAALFSGHLWRDLLPRAHELTPRLLWQDLVIHLRRRATQPAAAGPPYNLLQKCAYSGVVLIALPMMLVTGLSMSPAVNAAFPLADAFGGSQSARTVHFFFFLLLVLFVTAHIVMVILSGFRRQLRGMILGG